MVNFELGKPSGSDYLISLGEFESAEHFLHELAQKGVLMEKDGTFHLETGVNIQVEELLKIYRKIDAAIQDNISGRNELLRVATGLSILLLSLGVSISGVGAQEKPENELPIKGSTPAVIAQAPTTEAVNAVIEGPNAVTESSPDSGNFSVDAKVLDVIQETVQFGGVTAEVFLKVEFLGKTGVVQTFAVPVAADLPGGGSYIQGTGESQNAFPTQGMVNRSTANFPEGSMVNISFTDRVDENNGVFGVIQLADGVTTSYTKDELDAFAETEDLKDLPSAGNLSDGTPIVFVVRVQLNQSQ